MTKALGSGWKTIVGLACIAMTGAVKGGAESVGWIVPPNLEMFLGVVRHLGDFLLTVGVAHKLVKARGE